VVLFVKPRGIGGSGSSEAPRQGRPPRTRSHALGVQLLCFSIKLDLGASASVAKSLFHWLRGRFMMLKRMLPIQFL